uniref:DUF2281 domain-containing protein n=1 Tax=Candidatus Kentrum sp. DK TaxID=2126562 RepID=A0A450TES7_9GAMM|nr:MAG: Protein of unknown function (DUF2281) [Candidatus Kentron sp. DK]
MSIETQVLEGIRSLPPEKQSEVIGFIESIRQRNVASAPLRPIGLCQGEFTVPDDFDAPLPEDLLRDFES